MKKNIIYLVATIVILVIIVFTWLFVKRSSKSPMEKSIVVLPFSIDSIDKEDENLADGLLNGIIDNLTKANELKVIAKTSTIQFQDSNQSPSEIAKSLDVNYVVEGNVKTLNDSIEMQVRLLDETGDQIWSKTYIGSKNELSEIFDKIQQDITVTIR